MKCAMLWGVASLAVLELGVPRRANALGAAEPGGLSVRLEYEVPSNCPGVEDFKAIVVKRLGRDPFVEQGPNRVSTLVSAQDNMLSGTLVWRDSAGKWTGEQSFPSKTNHCEQLVAAMGFALAVQIHLLDIEEETALETHRSGSDAHAVEATTPAPPERTEAKSAAALTSAKHSEHRSEPRQAPLRLSLGAGGAIAIGMSSQIVPVGHLFLDLRWTSASVEAGLELSAPVTTRRVDGAGFSQSHLLSSIAGCGVLEPWSACALLKVGTVRAVGKQIDAPNSANSALVQSGLRLGFAQRLSSRVQFSLRAEGIVNLTRWSVELDQVSVWNAPPLGFLTGVDFLVLLR